MTGSLRVNTGQGAFLTTFSAVLPNNKCSTPVCPCEAIIIKSISSSAAVSTISTNGLPVLQARAHYRPWALVMSDHFLKLRKRKKTERKVLDMYGATNEAEFFAVATESFFEKPIQMRQRMPDLYEELQGFYGGDPAASTKSCRQ